MSRSTSSAQQNLTLTEELEKLEQSITLTLQEIDSNFSRAHRIVTSTILPIVEQYAEQSKDVWEQSKFWKQFFESSANVSLSGYEENPAGTAEQDTTEDSVTTTDNSTYNDESESFATPTSDQRIDLEGHSQSEEPDLSALSLSPSHNSNSTPRGPARPIKDEDFTSSSIDYPSPYESRYEEPSSSFDSTSDDLPHRHTTPPPTTPGKESRSQQRGYNSAYNYNYNYNYDDDNESMTPTTTPNPKKEDPLFHKMLDKTYRIQATPLASSRKTEASKSRYAAITPVKSRYSFPDSSPLSSPELEAPKLHPEIFDSPALGRKGGIGSTRKPRTPGVSVLTPAKKSKGKAPSHRASMWDSDDGYDDRDGDGDDDDDDDDGTGIFGHSPPKTMQFHVPQSRLMKTPAKEASRRIVSDILQTAGGDLTDDFDSFENSPSIVRRSEGLDDDTF